MLLSLSSQGSRDSVSLTILEGLAPSEGRLLLSSRLYPRHDAGHSRQRSHAAHGFTKKFGMASWTLEGPIMCDSIFKDLQVSSNILVPVAWYSLAEVYSILSWLMAQYASSRLLAASRHRYNMISTSRPCSLTTWQNRSCLVSLVHQLGGMTKGDCGKTKRETSIIHDYHSLSYSYKKISMFQLLQTIYQNSEYICTCRCIMYLHVLPPCYVARVFVNMCVQRMARAKALLGMRNAV